MIDALDDSVDMDMTTMSPVDEQTIMDAAPLHEFASTYADTGAVTMISTRPQRPTADTAAPTQPARPRPAAPAHAGPVPPAQVRQPQRRQPTGGSSPSYNRGEVLGHRHWALEHVLQRRRQKQIALFVALCLAGAAFGAMLAQDDAPPSIASSPARDAAKTLPPDGSGLATTTRDGLLSRTRDALEQRAWTEALDSLDRLESWSSPDAVRADPEGTEEAALRARAVAGQRHQQSLEALEQATDPAEILMRFVEISPDSPYRADAERILGERQAAVHQTAVDHARSLADGGDCAALATWIDDLGIGDGVAPAMSKSLEKALNRCQESVEHREGSSPQKR